MTLEIGLMLGVLALAVVLFSLERVPPDVTALGLLLLVAITGLVTPEQAFAGFGSDTVMGKVDAKLHEMAMTLQNYGRLQSNNDTKKKKRKK